jgi:ABC-2 type transport system ATP-binding protein
VGTGSPQRGRRLGLHRRERLKHPLGASLGSHVRFDTSSVGMALFISWPDGGPSLRRVTDGELAVDGRCVTKWFGEVTALDQVDIAVRPGTVHGLVGPNGAGKTTLLSALFGLVLPDEGTLRLFGRTRAEAGAHWLDGVGGFVETPRFYPYLSGRQNLAILAGLDDDGGAPEQTDGLLELVGLEGAGRRKVRGYSLGMRQRLGLAAALLRRPRLMILDEPTNGMDPAGIRDLRSAVRRLAQGGVAIILSSHDMGQVEEVCDSVTVLSEGRVAFAGGLDRMRAAAPDAAWRLHTNDDHLALAVARQVTELKISTHEDGGLLVVAAEERLDAYMVRLGRSGIAVRGLVLDVTPLESLFFSLTEKDATRAVKP